MPSTFINGLAEHIKNSYDLHKEELTVVFPNKRAAFYLRSRFKEIYEEDVWLPQMLSIQEAMTQWSGIQLVDHIDMLFELIAIDSQRTHQPNNISVFGSMATQIADDFDEIDQYEVDADKLFSYIYDEKKIGVWQLDQHITPKEEQYLQFFSSLKSYYHLLREQLERQGKGYYGMITRKLAGLTDEELLQRTGQRTILFAGFNALTPTEQRIIDKLYRNHHAEVIWDFDRYYVEDPQNEAGYFAQQYIAKNVPWKPTVFSDHLLHDPKEIHLVSVTGKTIQAKALQSLLQVEDEVNAAVILADENLIIPVLNAIPDRPEYPAVKVSMGYPMRQTPLNVFVSAFFTLHRKGRKVRDEGWYLWPVLRILDLELVKVVFSKEENLQLDRYRNMVQLKSLFIFKQDDFDACCQSTDLQTFTRLLLGSGDRKQASPQELVETLTLLLAFVADKLQQDEHQDKLFLLNQVSETGKALNRLKDIMARHQQYVGDLTELEILYRLIANNNAVKLNSSSTTGLQVMGLLEARNLDFDTYYMIGVNEGTLPAGKSSGSFIPHHIRREYHLPDYQEKQAVYAYHFYRQLQGAKRVYFLYNNQGASNGGEPSRFLLQIRYELAKRNPDIQLFDETFANQTEQSGIPERLTANKTEAVMEKLREKIQSSDPARALAPTSLSAFIQCPLRFFLKYVLKISDNSADEETQSNVIGSITHNMLELLYKDKLNTLITKELFANAIKPSIPLALKAALSNRFRQGLPDVGYNYLNKLTIERFIQHYEEFEEQQLSRHELCVTHLEHLLHTSLTLNGESYIIAGTADRIDRYDGNIRIVDYKTGGVEDKDVIVPQKIDSLSELDQVAKIPEKAMQLMIYKYLYLKEHPEVSPDQVTACLFALRSSRVLFDLKIENETLNEHFMDEMETMLHNILQTMTDPSVPFTQPEDPKRSPCGLCDFQQICANTVTGARLANDR